MLTSHMPMPTPTGPHAPKLDVRLVVLAFDLLAVQLLTNVSSSQQLPDHQHVTDKVERVIGDSKAKMGQGGGCRGR
jgi:hypothetical protein